MCLVLFWVFFVILVSCQMSETKTCMLFFPHINVKLRQGTLRCELRCCFYTGMKTVLHEQLQRNTG